MNTSQTPGVLYLEHLVSVNSSWNTALTDSAIRLAISDDTEAEYDVYDWLLECMDGEDPKVTKEDFEEFIGAKYDELREIFAADEVEEFDAALVIRAIEDADTECFLEIIEEDFPALHKALNEAS